MSDEHLSEDLAQSKRFAAKVERRDFLGLAALWSFLVTGVIMVIGMFRLPMPSVFPETGSKFKLGPPDRFPLGSSTLIADRNIFVRHDGSGIQVMSLICTHLGCIVTKEESGVWTCPCHGSRFHENGDVAKGPAPAPLRYLEVVMAPSGDLLVDRDRVVEADFRLVVEGRDS
jgi:cytochrome b6-f complex iron-sulfur subunit